MGKSERRRGRISNDPAHKSDEEIVQESISLLFSRLEINNLEKSLDKFLTNSKNKKRSRPPRPPNAFIIYRRIKMASREFKNRLIVNKRACNVSKEIASLWRNEPDGLKKVYYALQRMADKKHKEIYENYKYIRYI